MKITKQLLLLLALMAVGSISAQRGRYGMPATQVQTQREWIGRGTAQGQTQGTGQRVQMPASQGGVAAEEAEKTGTETRQAMPESCIENPGAC